MYNTRYATSNVGDENRQVPKVYRKAEKRKVMGMYRPAEGENGIGLYIQGGTTK